MDYIVQHGPISRAQVAKMSGLSKQTVSELVLMLEEHGWVREVGIVQGKLGRTAVTYELNPEAGYVAVADIGGTQIKLGVADVSGKLLEEVRIPLAAEGQQVADQLLHGINDLLAKNGIRQDKLLQLVVGVPGVVDRQKKQVHHSPNLPALQGGWLEEQLRESLKTQVLLENEVNLATIGEQWKGKGQQHGSFIFVAMGTGIGMGVVLDGKLWRGARGFAGEIGYMPVLDTIDPMVKQRGALESVASGHAILTQYATLTGQPATSLPEVFALAEAGDAVALGVMDSVAMSCAKAIAATATVVDPEVCILGGSIGSRPEMLVRVQEWLGKMMDEPLPVEANHLGKSAGLFGAIALALQAVNSRYFSPQHTFGEVVIPSA
ncbi:ROK family transcriptional regulator [Leeia oryzae]|uniref:ROK family transcriptional regulator n=1 Tax=Leeia oryzae TaxID=356662 RepID=UPI0014616286|nr:ROK family transcriptional regulator [Leeia oryzae]